MNILFGVGKQNIADKVMNLSSDTIKASLLTMAVATGKVALISSSTTASPIAITTSAAHGYVPGDIIVVGGHATNTAANGTWQAGAGTTGSTLNLTTRLDGNNSTGNGVGGATGWCVDITTAAVIGDLGGNGGSNGNGADISLTGVTVGAFGILNASSATWTSLSATKSYAVALYDSTASNDLIAWIDGNQQVYCATQAAASATAVALNRLSNAVANNTTAVFSDGSSAVLSAQANVGDTSFTTTALAAIVHRQATADVPTYNTVVGSTAGLPFTPGAGSSMTVTWDTGANKVFQI